MARVFLLLVAISIVFTACALISCLSAEKDRIRRLPRAIWALVIVFLPLVGASAWFLTGRRPGPDQFRRRRGGAPGRAPAPDDDPEFLRSIAERDHRQDQELFRRWEEDLRRREKDLGRGGDGPPRADDVHRREGDPPREEDRPEV